MVSMVVFDIETTGLNPYHHQIVVVGMVHDDKFLVLKCWEIGELGMILEALKILAMIPSWEPLVGFNNLKFDVPFITARLTIHGEMTDRFWHLLYSKKWIDLYQFLGDNYWSLETWLETYGIKRTYEEITGKDIPVLYERKEYEKIIQHNKDDLATCKELYKKLEEIHPFLSRNPFIS